MRLPEGKTRVQLEENVNQSVLSKNDIGYIDGYVQAADRRPYAIFVRSTDGVVDMVPLNSLTAF
jgi:hypothetical protein